MRSTDLTGLKLFEIDLQTPETEFCILLGRYKLPQMNTHAGGLTALCHRNSAE